jgi:hypothetical protein
MKFFIRLALLLVLAAVSAPWTAAQPAAGPAGHWEGGIQTPEGSLAIEVDLAKNDKGDWIGTINIPPQNLRGFPLSGITVKGNSVVFAMKGPPGDPRFEGTLDADAKSISGNFTQGGANLTFSVKRTGEAKIEPVAKSTPISKEMEGLWEGSLSAEGKTLRLRLNMSNQANGTAAGSIVSVDQNGAEIPITTITAQGSNLKLELKSIAGTFEGDLKDGTLVGQWTQGPGTLPLTFKRPAK